jgi:hypothetical protein
VFAIAVTIMAVQIFTWPASSPCLSPSCHDAVYYKKRLFKIKLIIKLIIVCKVLVINLMCQVRRDICV